MSQTEGAEWSQLLTQPCELNLKHETIIGQASDGHLPPHHGCVLDIHLLKHLLLQLAHVVKLVSQPEMKICEYFAI